jgi:CheY-like chemotaxis protein
MSGWLLVVEDDPDGRELLTELLAVSGLDVVACGSGSEAASTLDSRGKPNLVLTDLALPDMAGSAFVAGMRNRPGFEIVPVVFVTGTEPSLLEEIRDPILRKPIDVDQLLDLVALHSQGETPGTSLE